MDVNVSIGGGQKMALTGAVLVYRGGTDAFAVWHPAKPGLVGGAPYLGEAESLTTEFLRMLAAGLGTYIPPEILPANVLVRTSEVLGVQATPVPTVAPVAAIVADAPVVPAAPPPPTSNATT